MNLLPNEVEAFIIGFLIADSNIVSRVSRRWRAMVLADPFWAERTRLHNTIGMMLLDKRKQIDRTGTLGKLWEDHHKWSWSSYTGAQETMPLWKVGDYVDVLDKINVWGPARIINKNLNPFAEVDPSCNRSELLHGVEFLGWASCFNEYVGSSKIRPLGSMSIHPANKFESMREGHRFWGLFRRSSGRWWMDSLIVRDISGNSKCIGNGFEFKTVTPDNVDDNIRAVSDGSTYLTLGDRGFHPHDRRLVL